MAFDTFLDLSSGNDGDETGSQPALLSRVLDEALAGDDESVPIAIALGSRLSGIPGRPRVSSSPMPGSASLSERGQGRWSKWPAGQRIPLQRSPSYGRAGCAVAGPAQV